jgi:hypothetical protein
MDGTGDHHVKQNKPVTDRHIFSRIGILTTAAAATTTKQISE